MRGRKPMERKQVLRRTLYTRFRLEDAKRIDKASSAENKTYADFIRGAVMEKVERMGF